ncbi:hypothetical protein GMORB2_6921 [Geosmithia morbida]|uniref:Uncharacterized protein n=1 Tax=Geosmithia morbida TaxID=1094350 RepID=A0A9P5D5L4_9HYPO|nr:uncharacterized protein GMORB2_6921 [Geosmithia morbida]KAF4122614.1 hypothetical protein GMORB2_6921 [Geosmithia morbida]
MVASRTSACSMMTRKSVQQFPQEAMVCRHGTSPGLEVTPRPGMMEDTRARRRETLTTGRGSHGQEVPANQARAVIVGAAVEAEVVVVVGYAAEDPVGGPPEDVIDRQDQPGAGLLGPDEAATRAGVSVDGGGSTAVPGPYTRLDRAGPGI